MIHSTREYLLYAENQHLAPSEFRFIPAKSFSPYMECVPTTLNRISMGDGTVEVNPYYKYERIFAQLLNSFDSEQFREARNYVFDFWVREAFRYERMEGATKQSLERKELAKEALAGELGSKIQAAAETFDDEERDYVFGCVIKLYKGGDAINLFTKAVKKILPDAWLYVLDQKEILIYAGEKENYLMKKKLQCLQQTFLPIGTEAEVFWEKHFGVFGIEDAMRLDEVVMI